jgi:K+-sensing histidine kinase KdpD
VIVVPPIHDLAQLYGGVCVAVELDADAAGPLRFGFDEASARDARLIVLHIATESLDRDGVEAQRLGVAEVLAGWREDFPDVRVATRVVLADEVVAEVARVSGRTELLVVGRPRHHLVFGARAASRLAREAHCPLAIVDEADESAATARVADAGAAR